MLKKTQRIQSALDICSDAALLLLSYFIAVYIRFHIMNGILSVPHVRGRVLTITVLYCAAAVFAFSCFELYGEHRIVRRRVGIVTILSVNAFGILILTAVFALLHIENFSRLAMFFFWAVSGLLLVAKHELVTQLARRRADRGIGLLNIAVVGDGPLALQFLRDRAEYRMSGFAVAGYVGEENGQFSVRRLGDYDELPQILDEYPLDCLVVALEAHETRYLNTVLSAAEKEGLRVELIPFYNDYLPTHPTIEIVGRSKLINLAATPLDSMGWAFLKRLTDILGSLILIVLTSPLMLISAIGVKLSSPGPILFRQERVGKDKKPFNMLKFRSMRTDIDHSGWSTDVDPRKTRFGSFLRKFSIDELPQLFNVLAGQMSLVGPRPEIPRYVRQFKEDVPLYLVRQQTRPGMTGWAQIHGLRGNTSIEKRVEYDIWYIENWTLGLDVMILLRTALGGFINTEKLTSSGQAEAEEEPSEEPASEDGAPVR